jgi:phosphoglycolate phosphatase-like HAD superfamily hydrolase
MDITEDHLNNYKTIVFDWDGTLFDSMPNKTRNLGILLHRHFNFPPETVMTLYRRYSGISRRKLLTQIISELKPGFSLSYGTFQKLSDEFSQLNLEANKNAPLFPDVLPCLDRLHHSGQALYISSSSRPEELGPLVTMTGIESQFKAIFSSRQGFDKGKEHLTEICRLENCLPKNLLVIGDDVQDVVLAEKFGAKALRIRRDQPEESLGMVNSLSSLTRRVSNNS